MEQAVTDGVETTSPVASPATETDNTVQTTNESSSSQDVNTEESSTSEGNGDLVEQASGEVRSEKGQNRVQELANKLRASEERASEVEKELAELRQNRTQVDQYMNQPVQDRTQHIDPIALLNHRQTLLEQEIRVNNRRSQLKEYETTYPDVAENPIMDTYVAKELKLNPDANIHTIVAEVKKLYAQSTSKVSAEAEQRIINREVVGAGQRNAGSEVAGSGADEVEEARQAYKSASGSEKAKLFRKYKSLQMQKQQA